ncbi:unnamed protein product [Lactuca virosa]|uniref:Transmembrane protein n=1 Tax=Lactuca virosa TaxID=75947 RepID=A0AAU9M039_9ASTR|nr:unnamed protein product [Lactuca virosa]
MGVPPPSAAMRNFLKILTVILVFFFFISIIFTFQGLSLLPLSSFKQSYAASHNTTTKDYSAGLTKLRSLYLYFALVYLCFLGCWIFVCFKNYPSFHWIHLLMGMLLIMKGLNLLCASEVQHSIKVTGTPPHGWNVLLYIFPVIRTMLLYTVIAISKGWSFQVMLFSMILIPLQVLSTFAFQTALHVLLENSFSDLGIWMADHVCQVLLTGFVSRKTLEIGQAVKSYLAHFILYSLFYIVLIVYSINVFVYGVGNSVNCNYLWAMAAETISLLFYIIMFSLFRPFERNEYLVRLNLQVPVVPVRD